MPLLVPALVFGDLLVDLFREALPLAPPPGRGTLGSLNLDPGTSEFFNTLSMSFNFGGDV